MTHLSSEAVRLAELLSADPTESPVSLAAANILRRIPELEAWKAKVIKSAEEAHGPGAFRFKMSLNSRGSASNVFPQWLDQLWVSFVYAEDDAHIGLHARIAQLEAERDQLRAELEKVRWQPIEAAPTGEQVLLFGSRGLEWFVDDWGRYAKYNNPRITHWMPLPAAPTSPNADQKGQW